MFIVLIDFPPVKPGKEGEFKEWFVWSNREFATFKGFIGRRLLKPRDGENYASLVEFESGEDFAALQTSPLHKEAAARVAPLLDGGPTPHFYDVLTE